MTSVEDMKLFREWRWHSAPHIASGDYTSVMYFNPVTSRRCTHSITCTPLFRLTRPPLLQLRTSSASHDT